MTFEWWCAYLLTSIILSLSPGSGAINTMTTSINHGYRGAAASIAGLQTGLGIHIVLVGVGLGTLFSRSLLAFEILKWAGAAYLIWLGIQQWRAAGSIDLNTLAKVQTRGKLFKRAVFVNLTNPKSIVFLAALFPQFIVPNQPQVMQYLVLGVTTIVGVVSVINGLNVYVREKIIVLSPDVYILTRFGIIQSRIRRAIPIQGLLQKVEPLGCIGRQGFRQLEPDDG